MSDLQAVKEEIAALRERVEGNGSPGHRDVVRVLFGDRSNDGVAETVRKHELRLVELEDYRRKERTWRRGIAIGLLLPIADVLLNRLPALLKVLPWF